LELLPLESLPAQPLKLSNAESASDGSSVDRLYKDFFSPNGFPAEDATLHQVPTDPIAAPERSSPLSDPFAPTAAWTAGKSGTLHLSDTIAATDTSDAAAPGVSPALPFDPDE
jgi:hypothetical protein